MRASWWPEAVLLPGLPASSLSGRRFIAAHIADSGRAGMRGFADVLPLRFASSVLTAIASKAIGGTPSWRDAVARSARPRTAGGIGAASTLTGITCGRASGLSLTRATHAAAQGRPGAPARLARV